MARQPVSAERIPTKAITRRNAAGVILLSAALVCLVLAGLVVYLELGYHRTYGCFATEILDPCGGGAVGGILLFAFAMAVPIASGLFLVRAARRAFRSRG